MNQRGNAAEQQNKKQVENEIPCRAQLLNLFAFHRHYPAGFDVPDYVTAYIAVTVLAVASQAHFFAHVERLF